MNYIDKLKRVKEDAEWLESEIKRLHGRMDEYHILFEKIDGLVGGSESKLASKISELIDKHYEL